MRVTQMRCGLAVMLFATLLPRVAAAQFTTPNEITAANDVTTTLGQTVFINHGIVGVGRLPASGLDTFGETFGSVSSMQITGWTSLGNGSYAGMMNILPDRGYNSDPFSIAAPVNGRADRAGRSLTRSE